MKYHIALIVLLILGASIVADGYVRTGRARHQALMVNANVLTMSQQQLAISLGECDSPSPAGEHVKRDATFCAEVARVLDNQPLQIVDEWPPPMVVPLSLPPLRLHKATIPPLPPLPAYPEPQVSIPDKVA